MKINLQARLVAAIAQFKADTDIRYYLCGVYVEPLPGGGAIIIATNGHSLGMWRDESGEVERPAILRIGKKLAAACTGSSTRRLQLTSGHLTVVNDDGTEVYIQPSESLKKDDWEVPGKFAEIKRVIPDAFEGTMLRNSMNPAYIAMVQKALAIGLGTKLNWQCIAFTQNTLSSAVAVTSNAAANFVGIIMPVNDDSHKYPDWLKAYKKPPAAKSLPLPGQQPSDATPPPGAAA